MNDPYAADTSLEVAAESGDMDAVSALLAAGADQSANGYWALRQAAKGSHFRVMQILLDARPDLGAEINPHDFLHVEYEPCVWNSLEFGTHGLSLGSRLMVGMMVMLEHRSWFRKPAPPGMLEAVQNLAKTCAVQSADIDGALALLVRGGHDDWLQVCLVHCPPSTPEVAASLLRLAAGDPVELELPPNPYQDPPSWPAVVTCLLRALPYPPETVTQVRQHVLRDATQVAAILDAHIALMSLAAPQLVTPSPQAIRQRL